MKDKEVIMKRIIDYFDILEKNSLRGQQITEAQKQDLIRTFVKRITLTTYYTNDPLDGKPIKHQDIMVELKFDELTDYKLENLWEVNYSKSGQRVERDAKNLTKESLLLITIIKPDLNDINKSVGNSNISFLKTEPVLLSEEEHEYTPD